jgi:hypothetical protein
LNGHFYTISPAERDSLISNHPRGRGITESCGWRDGKERRIILEVKGNNVKSRKGYATWNKVHQRPSVCQSGREIF